MIVRSLSAVFVFAVACSALAVAQEPDDLKLPQGFHASVVAEGLGPVRHLAVRENGDLYLSTLDRGIIALHLDANHKADQIVNFGAVQGGTGIAFYHGALYASNNVGVYRFTFSNSKQLVPERIPDAIVRGLPLRDTGFNRENRTLALDDKGDLYVTVTASANFCLARTPPGAAAPAKPVGAKPCPDLASRSGIWRFSADKVEQKFPADAEQLATGIRDMIALAWSPVDEHVYGVMHGRDQTNSNWPDLVSAADDANIADEMHRVTKGTDFGWPYTYYDGARKLRLVSPEYGGDGKTAAPVDTYDAPALTFFGPRAAPEDLVFYTGRTFPASYRNGAFIALHGTRNQSGYNVVFVPMNPQGVAGPAAVFADGFAAFSAASKTAKYRPVGIAVGPDGALYVADSQKGRVWRIAYGSN